MHRHSFYNRETGAHHAHLVQQFIPGYIRITFMLNVKTQDRIDGAIIIKILIIHFGRLFIAGFALGV